MSTFPMSYKEIIKKSQLKHDEIAALLHLSKKRWQSLWYGHGRMDNSEFRNIKGLIEQLDHKEIVND